jgi:hypothetical protein
VLPKGVNWRNDLLPLMYPQTGGDEAGGPERSRSEPRVLEETAPRGARNA